MSRTLCENSKTKKRARENYESYIDKKYKLENIVNDNRVSNNILHVMYEKIHINEIALNNSNMKIQQLQLQLAHVYNLNDTYKKQLSDICQYLGLDNVKLNDTPSYIS